MNSSFIQKNLWIFVILAIWDLVCKGLALWKAARNKVKYWFTVLFIINSAGILPIIYLKFFAGKNKGGK